MAKDPRNYTKKELGRDFTMYGAEQSNPQAKRAVTRKLKEMGLTSTQIREAFETPVSGSKAIGKRNVLLSKGRKGKGSPGTDYTKGKQAPNFKKSKRKSPGRPTMTSVVAKAPKPRNKNVTKRPTRPSSPSMTSMGAKKRKATNSGTSRRPKRPSKQGSFGR